MQIFRVAPKYLQVDVAAFTCRQEVKTGEDNAWNNPDCVFDSGTRRRSASVVAQPIVGLLPDRGIRAGASNRSGARTHWPTLM
jgi:hypothetical protein